jgi:SAM-dependent methyltransferase
MSIRHSIRLRLAAPPEDRETWVPVGEREAVTEFKARARELSAPRVLELGTLRSIAERCTMHHDYVPQAGEFLGTDIQAGPDVDIVADVHQLTEVVGRESFDIIISCSTFEHLKYPHLAAHEVMKALKVGGLLFIQTHQSFPIHAFPFDYFRFTREALAGLFGTRMGVEVLATNYQFHAAIWAREVESLFAHPAFLNVNLFAVKTGPTPEEYVYELEYAAQG